uniref:Uncharacterized protein n=1 Tax=Rhizophora mucronata TaxID=61149 RepID=A0A2P2NQS9_RHIMU
METQDMSVNHTRLSGFTL